MGSDAEILLDGLLKTAAIAGASNKQARVVRWLVKLLGLLRDPFSYLYKDVGGR